MDQGTGVHKPFRTLEEMALRVTKGANRTRTGTQNELFGPTIERMPDRAMVESANPEMANFCTQTDDVLDRKYEGNNTF